MFYETDLGMIRRRLGRGGRIIYDRMNKPISDEAQQDDPEYQEVDFFKKIFVKRIDDHDEVGSSLKSSPPFQLGSGAVCPKVSLNDVEIICGIDS